MSRASQATFAKQQAAERAKKSLRHYLGKALPFPLTGDLGAEVDSIVDDIIEASVAGARAEQLEERARLRARKKKNAGK